MFRLRDYHAFLSLIAPEAAAFKAEQQKAFEAERERWAATEFVPADEPGVNVDSGGSASPANGSFVDSPIAGNLWKASRKSRRSSRRRSACGHRRIDENGNANLRHPRR